MGGGDGNLLAPQGKAAGHQGEGPRTGNPGAFRMFTCAYEYGLLPPSVFWIFRSSRSIFCSNA